MSVALTRSGVHNWNAYLQKTSKPTLPDDYASPYTPRNASLVLLHTPSKYQHSLIEHVDKDMRRLTYYDRVLANLMAATRMKVSPSLKPEDAKPTKRPPMARIKTIEVKKFKVGSPKISVKQIEELRDYVRMDKGMPKMFQKEPTPINRPHSVPPRIIPKVNIVSALRYRYARRAVYDAYLKSGLYNGARDKADWRVRHMDQSLQLLKKKSEKYLKSPWPKYKFNKLFELRYKYNQGYPVMPVVLEKYFYNYRKLPFRVVQKLELPKKYLQPEVEENTVSYLGLIVDEDYTSSDNTMDHVEDTRPAIEKARPPLPKTKRVPRRTKPSLRVGKKMPWNYGTFKKRNK